MNPRETARLLALLKRMEWGYESLCPCCGADRRRGHTQTCELDYAIGDLEYAIDEPNSPKNLRVRRRNRT